MLLATGGGPTMYQYHTPSGDKTCDGMAMALRAGLPLRDMEMVQFHPTGLLAGTGTRMTGTVLEEGLRGAGGYLLERRAASASWQRYDPRSSAPRATSSRARSTPRCAPAAPRRTAASTSRWRISAPDNVRKQFKGMVERCADCGFDLAGGLVEVVPTAHYMMGGVVFAADCSTALPGLFAAGEDTGGVHGANRLGGNGVANSTVFGGIAGDRMAALGARAKAPGVAPDEAAIAASVAAHEAPFAKPPGDLEPIREALFDCMWDDVGILRTAEGLQRAAATLAELDARLTRIGVADGDRAFNLTLARLAQPEEPDRREPGHRRLGAGARGLARRAFSRRPSRDGRPRELELHRRRAARRRARDPARGGAVHPRRAGPDRHRE